MRRCLRFAGLAMLLWGVALPTLAQTPPVAAPDVTTLPAPADAGSGSGDAADATPAPPPCGTRAITIARMSWPSAALLAEIDARLLRNELGCTVQVQQSDLAATASSMANVGQPAVAPEMWTARVADIWNSAINAQKLRQVAPSYLENAFEGWYIPDYVAQARPGITSAASLKDNLPAFATGGKKGKFISCPADWACAVINRNLLKANGLDQSFDVVTPGNRYEMDQLIAEAVSGKQPVVFYYWQPNAVLAQFSFKSLDMGPFNKDNFACLGNRNCASPQPSGFAGEPVVAAVADWVFTAAPQVAAYFQRASMPIKEMNGLLQALNAPGATIESVADSFVATRQTIWRPWVGAAAP